MPRQIVKEIEARFKASTAEYRREIAQAGKITTDLKAQISQASEAIRKASNLSGKQAQQLSRELSAAGKTAERLGAVAKSLVGKERELSRAVAEQKQRLGDLKTEFERLSGEPKRLNDIYDTIKEATKGLDLSTPLAKQREQASAAVDKLKADYDTLAETIRSAQEANPGGMKGVGALDAAIADMKSRMSELQTVKSKSTNYDDYSSAVMGIKTLQQEIDKTAVKRDQLLKGAPVNLQLPDGSISSMAEAQEKLRAIGNELEQARTRSAKLQSAIQSIGTENLGYASKAGLKQLQSEAASAQGKLNQLEQQAGQTESRLKTYGERLEDVHRQQEELGASSERLRERISEIGDAASNSLGGRISERLSNAGKAITSGLASKLKQLAAGFMGLGSGARASGGGMLSSLKTMLRYAVGIRSLYALVGRLRSALTSGLQALAKHSGTTNRAISSLSSAMKQMEGSIASAFAPLVNVAAPYVTTFVRHIADAFNAVGAFFAALTGQSSYTKAVYNYQGISDSAKDAAGATKKATDAQKELNRELYSFDEINKQSDNSGSGGSGGGSGGSGGSGSSGGGLAFVTEGIPGLASDWAQMFRDAWAKADFTEIGGIIGGKLRDALDSIPWDEIKKTAQKVAKSLATLLNGFIETEGLSQSIGKTIAEALNTGFIEVNTFAENFHWDSLGEFISSGIQAAFNKFDWGGVTRALSNALKAALDFSSGFLSGIDWKALPGNVANAFKEAVEGFNFKGVFNSAGKLVGAALAAAIDFGSGLVDLGKRLFTAIGDYFTEHIDEAKKSGGSVADGILQGIADAFLSVGKWVKDNILDPFIKGFKAAFGIHSPAKEMNEPGRMVGEGILNGIAAVFTNIGAWVKEHILQPIKDALGNVGAKISVGISLLKDGWSTVSAWVKEHIGGGVSKGIELAKSGWSSVAAWVKDKLGGGVSKGIGLAKDKWKNVSGWVKDNLGKGVSFAIGLAKGWKGTVAKALGLDKLASKFSIKLPKVSVTWSGSPIKLPHFSVKWNAKGGILDGAQIFGMAGNTLLGGGERGREAVLPLDRNDGWKDEIADRVAARVSGQDRGVGGSQTININLITNEGVIGRATVNYLRNQARQGNHPLTAYI